jgi:hypothetical protein
MLHFRNTKSLAPLYYEYSASRDWSGDCARSA